MLAQYGERYRHYMNTTGMFFPQSIEKMFSFMQPIVPQGAMKYPALCVLIVTLVIGTGFILRAVTLHSLYFESKDNISLVSLLPEDNKLDAVALESILKTQGQGTLTMLDTRKNYLGYLMPGDYVMQGMIANTGENFHLFKQHHTVMMITEWVLHPFQHLRSSPTFHMAKMHGVDPETARRHHCPLGINDPALDCKTCPYRRVILDEVSNETGGKLTGKGLLSFGTTRMPVAFVDINTKTGELVNAQKVAAATAWADVPTPAI